MRVAAIDCGTNSIRLLVADVDPAARAMTDLARTMTVVRLGQGVDRTGRLAPEAVARTLAEVEVIAARCAELGVERARFVATSATRDASNREEFIAGVRSRLGIEPEVISGDEEARLSFAGATSRLDPALAPYLVVDIGGGSTELVLGSTEPTAAHSMDVGCVRLTERLLGNDPPRRAELELASATVREALDRAHLDVPLGDARTVVGVAGSVTTVTAHVLRLDAYRPELIDGSVVGLAEAIAAADDLVALTRDARAALPFMHPGRVDVIGAGALVWREILARVRDDVAAAGGSLDTVTTSEHDILDGIALALAG